MKKQFLVNFSILLLLNICVKPAWIFGDLMVQRSTGDAYGNYFALLNLTMILNMVLDFGLTNYNNRKVAGNPKQFTSLFRQIVPIRFALSILYFLLLFLSSLIFSITAYDLKMLVILGVNQVLLSFILYFRSNITGLGLFKTDSVISIVDRSVMLALLAYLFFARGSVNIENFVWIQFLGYLASFLLTFVIMIMKGGRLSFKVDIRFGKKCLYQSFPYALIVLLMAGYSYSDSVMIRQLCERADWQNAIYAKSFRILMALNNYVYLVAVLLLPMFSRLLKQKEAIRPLLKLSGSLVIYAMISVALFSFFYSEEIIRLLYVEFPKGTSLSDRFFGIVHSIDSSDILVSKSVFQVLIFACIPMSFNYLYGVLLTADGKMKILNSIAGAGLAANIILNLYLIPKSGALGAATASVITQSLAAILQWWFCYREFKIKIDFRHIFKFVAAIMILIAAWTYSKAFFEGYVPILIFVVSAVLLALSLGLVPIKEIRKHFMKSEL